MLAQLIHNNQGYLLLAQFNHNIQGYFMLAQFMHIIQGYFMLAQFTCIIQSYFTIAKTVRNHMIAPYDCPSAIKPHKYGFMNNLNLTKL